MQKPQDDEKSLSSSKQLPSFTPVNSSSPEYAPETSQRVVAAWENASLKTQQLAIASTVAVISALAVLAVIQISAHINQPLVSTALSQPTAIALSALTTGVTAGLTTLALGQIITNRIHRSLDNLQSQFQAVAQGDLGVQATVDSSNELGQLAMSFNQMTQALNTRLNQAQGQASGQDKEENLQQTLMQVNSGLELTSNGNLLEVEVISREYDELDITPEGTLLDFLDNLHNWFKVTTNPEQLAGSSTLEELQQRKEELQYRQVWLQALQDETSRELQFLSLVGQSTIPEQIRETQEGEKVV
ncbi:MAG TPA: hypothetical protein DCE56_03925 [Cyanobacteria bacterium UBA8553]|nr:hypothetical protein [Cyanobacteria bacterium UBA8553]HAJ64370.1 hypothetical protein [Cyanobacteria bacterium UBA8543]